MVGREFDDLNETLPGATTRATARVDRFYVKHLNARNMVVKSSEVFPCKRAIIDDGDLALPNG